MTFTIDKDIPFESVVGARGRKPTQFPLSELEKGDSFLIPCDPTSKKDLDSWRRKLLGAKKRFAAEFKADGIKFNTLAVNDDKKGKGLRVYRTA
jgi:hypothetical protein